MKIDEGLYKTFLEEMNALENFRIAYAALHPGISMDREDPDVRRLMEAMALFSARTRLAGARQIGAVNLRIFRQYFPYLLAPLPSMAVVQAVPSRQFVEPLFFPKGAEIAVSPESGGTAIFQTMDELRVFPVRLSRYQMMTLPSGRGFRLCLQLNASFARGEELGDVKFLINHLNNYEASQRVFYTLQRHLKRAFVVYDERVTETSSGAAASISFGASAGDDAEHPLEKERQFFHFPWQGLFMKVEIPQARRSWTECTICLEIAPGWPRNLVLNQDVFQLFTVPVINRRKSTAQPITCDGTKEDYAIRHPETESGFELHSIQGVFEVAKEGMRFVKPGILSGSAPSYETEELTDSEGNRRHVLKIYFPEAFEQPKTITTEALWFQPWFSERISQRCSVSPFARSTVGLKWELPVNPVPHAGNQFQNTTEGFLHFLALTNRETLNKDDLLDILQTLGVGRQRAFQAFCELLTGIRVEKIPMHDTHVSGLVKQRYILSFRTYDASREPLMDVFLAHVENILNAWLSEARIEVAKEMTGGAAAPL